MENILLYTTIGLALLVIILFILFFRLTKRIKKLSAGKETKSLESIILENNELIKKTKMRQEYNTTHITQIRSDIAKAIQNISVVRFDALGDSSGMQSFAIGLTDNHKNGIVISSMYARDRMNVFAKEIVGGESKHKLTEEEKKAISN